MYSRAGPRFGSPLSLAIVYQPRSPFTSAFRPLKSAQWQSLRWLGRWEQPLHAACVMAIKCPGCKFSQHVHGSLHVHVRDLSKQKMTRHQVAEVAAKVAEVEGEDSAQTTGSADAFGWRTMGGCRAEVAGFLGDRRYAVLQTELVQYTRVGTQ